MMTGYESKRAAAQAKTIDEVNWVGHEPNGLVQPEEEKLHPVSIGVDVTQAGTSVTAFYRKPDAVMEMFYAQFHPMPQPAQEPVAWIYKGEKSFDGNKWVDEYELTTSKQVALWKDKDAKPLYTALPQPAQEPVAWCSQCGHKCPLPAQEREALKLALEALLNSVDLVTEDAYNAEKLYGNYPTRQARIGGLKGLADKHREAITAAEEALAQPEQEPVATLFGTLPVYDTAPPQPAQEPVAWLCKADENGLFGLPTADKACKDCFPVYTTLPLPAQEREALKLALEFVEDVNFGEWQGSTKRQEEIITAIKKALAQPAQEPVAHFGSAYINENGVHITTVLGPVAIPQDAKLYTAPPQRPWVGLTDEEVCEICDSYYNRDSELAQMVEAKLRSKNT